MQSILDIDDLPMIYRQQGENTRHTLAVCGQSFGRTPGTDFEPKETPHGPMIGGGQR